MGASCLDHGDIEAVSGFLRELYSELRIERFPQAALAGLMRLIPCEHIGYNEINTRTNATILEVYPALPRIFELLPVLESHFQEHPLLNHFRVSTDRKPRQITDFISHRQFRRTGLYQEVYRHIDTENQMGLLLSESDSPCDIGMAFNRHNADFSDRDRAVLEFLRPHLILARRNALAFSMAERKTDALHRAVNQAGVGVMVLNQDARIEWASHSAISLMEAYFQDSIRPPNQLPEPLGRWVALWRKQLVNGQQARLPLDPFVIAAERGRLTVQCAAGVDGTVRLLLAERQIGLDRERGRAHAFGLTPREAEVMHWIVEGKTNPEIALLLGTSARTIHKHVERILAKLRVPTRSAAVREILWPSCP